MRDLVYVALALVVGGCASADMAARAMESPNLGREATPAQIAGWDISVAPDGVGLPPGKGTPATGCSCTSRSARRATARRAPGSPTTDSSEARERSPATRRCGRSAATGPYATTVFDYVRRAMPYIQPQSLTDDEVYAVTAYLLNLNGIIGENDEMNAQTLPKVKMPNQSNFIVVYPSRGK
jgi:cytochrome c